jgi:hypothetical protein
VPSAADPEQPIACTLDVEAIPDRLEEWQAVLGRATARTRAAGGGLRVELPGDMDLGELTRLVTAEQRCCAFFAFAITVDARGLGLEVRSPAGGDAVIAALFGEPDPAVS